jgi:hypothetical protein
MWKIAGIYYLIVAQNMFQVVDMHYFETPQECFMQAMSIMEDNQDPRNMACVPIYKEPEGQDT